MVIALIGLDSGLIGQDVHVSIILMSLTIGTPVLLRNGSSDMELPLRGADLLLWESRCHYGPAPGLEPDSSHGP